MAKGKEGKPAVASSVTEHKKQKAQGNKAGGTKPAAKPEPAAVDSVKKGAAPGKAADGKKNEIDDIFNVGKKAAAGAESAGSDAVDADVPDELKELAEKIKRARDKNKAQAPVEGGPSKKQKVEGSKDDIFGDGSNTKRKRTEEGYPIYSEEELGLGKKGGDTDLCPFDCDCCF